MSWEWLQVTKYFLKLHLLGDMQKLLYLAYLLLNNIGTSLDTKERSWTIICCIAFHIQKPKFYERKSAFTMLLRKQNRKNLGCAGNLFVASCMLYIQCSCQLCELKDVLLDSLFASLISVLPAFSGNVPAALKSVYPSAKIMRLGNWYVFTPEKQIT